jgi:hypothetical protein
MPETSRTATTVEEHLPTGVYQAQLRHHAFAPLLNRVISVKTNRHTHAKAHVIRFSRDPERPDDTLRDDDRLRFPIACHGRDATPDWGLADGVPITPTGVTKAAILALFMVTVAYRRHADVPQHDPDDRILDLKADGRGDTDVEETSTMLPATPAPV